MNRARRKSFILTWFLCIAINNFKCIYAPLQLFLWLFKWSHQPTVPMLNNLYINTSTALKLFEINGRRSMLVESENEYLSVHRNMPSLTKWKPRIAVVKETRTQVARYSKSYRTGLVQWNFSWKWFGINWQRKIHTHEFDQEDDSHKTKTQRIF